MSKKVKFDAPEHIERITVKGRKHKERLIVIPEHFIDEHTGERQVSPEAYDAIWEIHNTQFLPFYDQIELTKKCCTEFLTKAFKGKTVEYQTSVTTIIAIDGKEYKSGFRSFYCYLVAPSPTGGGFEHDSVEAMFAELLHHIELMQNEKDTIETRLQRAAVFGELRFKLFAIFIPESKAQSKKASKERGSSKAKRIIDNLKNRKASSDETTKELWQAFINMMGDDIEEVHDKNKHNASSWKLKFSYFNNKGNEKIQSMTFGTFQNKLKKQK